MSGYRNRNRCFGFGVCSLLTLRSGIWGLGIRASGTIGLTKPEKKNKIAVFTKRQGNAGELQFVTALDSSK